MDVLNIVCKVAGLVLNSLSIVDKIHTYWKTKKKNPSGGSPDGLESQS